MTSSNLQAAPTSDGNHFLDDKEDRDAQVDFKAESKNVFLSLKLVQTGA